MCEYCKGEKNLKDNTLSRPPSYYEGIEVSIDNGVLNCDAPRYDYVLIRINYCPMCGIKLLK